MLISGDQNAGDSSSIVCPLLAPTTDVQYTAGHLSRY